LKEKITTDLTEIHITNGNFVELPANAFSDCASNTSAKLIKLTKLVLSNNNIGKIHGKTFHCMPNLQKLFLDRNKWEIQNDTHHTGYFNNLPNLVELDLTSTFFVSSGLHIIRLRQVLYNSSFLKLETLRLGYNDMQFVDDAFGKALCTMDSLKHVNLQGNSLFKLAFTHCFQKSKQLEKIDLSDNALATLDQRSMTVFDHIVSSNEKVNLTVNLLNQQWSCDCNIKPFRRWMDTTKVHLIGKEKYRCHDGANFNKTIFHLTDAEMVCNHEIDSSVQAGVVVMIVLLVIIAVALIAAIVLYRGRLASLASGVRKSLTRESHVQYSSVDNAPLTAEA
jgi:Leucine-rich repeat (LRR) protein